MGVTLAYSMWGQGTRPLVLLHGFTGNRSSFDHLRPMLGGAVKAIAVDLPGHGETPLPERKGREGFIETVQAVVELVERLGLHSVDLMGYSQGARIALGAALHSPRHFGRLILESGSPGLHRRMERAERREEDGRRASFIQLNGVEAFIDRWEAMPLFDGLRRLPPEQQAALRQRRSSCTVEGLVGALGCLGLGVQPDYWSELHRQRLPTLLLTGAQDEKFTQLARRMATELPVVWRHTFENCGHAPHLEVPEAFAREVLAFLDTPWYESPEFESASPESPS
ncbi:2-succinyl-6-hydroxy-2,4-cyclohexadiene-1-carboxylate synthase [Hyalangium rubrum]|uniref:Putative 2-succinyl-6-hydroxy-2,4-cyclohexadiene-1-carboxylate synthase n=1 Tax=Hyalangium rubrum TaxID=3103134 RepID=A0ABU5HFN6_9BACT|nr:2-succinyl-6-hydroxy-2,4-cyclohexadiene-1-carboxylate synthase [Hyalangium sp. s54d21]MDY7231612.1 2-succinyl-6-hydroxy-2,4-cyclohexadiene-1-carboxylate synthase [Hyalangium sp. s54d21]